MKSIFALLLLISVSFSAPAAPKIHSASNVNGKTAILEVWDLKPALIEVNLETAAAVNLGWPDLVGQREIMGQFLIEDRLFIIAQWTLGDGRKPQILEYNRAKKSWGAGPEFDCESFDQVKVSRGAMSIACEANPRTGNASREVRVKLESLKIQTPLKLVLPLSEARGASHGYRLQGDLMSWKSIVLLKGARETKVVTADDLAQTK